MILHNDFCTQILHLWKLILQIAKLKFRQKKAGSEDCFCGLEVEVYELREPIQTIDLNDCCGANDGHGQSPTE